jgi:hypothetical protein
MDSSFRRLRWVRLGVEERPYAAFVLSLVGGVLILVGGLLGLTWLGWPMWGWWGMGMMGWGMMWGWMPGFLLAFSAVCLVSGAAVVTAAYMLYNKPSQAQTWGTIVLVFAAVSLLSAGGFIIGALLGIVGGLLALTWRRPT